MAKAPKQLTENKTFYIHILQYKEKGGIRFIAICPSLSEYAYMDKRSFAKSNSKYEVAKARERILKSAERDFKTHIFHSAMRVPEVLNSPSMNKKKRLEKIRQLLLIKHPEAVENGEEIAILSFKVPKNPKEFEEMRKKEASVPIQVSYSAQIKSGSFYKKNPPKIPNSLAA